MSEEFLEDLDDIFAQINLDRATLAVFYRLKQLVLIFENLIFERIKHVDQAIFVERMRGGTPLLLPHLITFRKEERIAE